MNRKSKAKRILSILLLLCMVLGMLPSVAFADSKLSEIRLTSATKEVPEGTLPKFTAQSSTTGVDSIDERNCRWMKWNGAAWMAAQDAVKDGKTHYALMIAVRLKDGYAFDENTKIYFNGIDVTNKGYTQLKIWNWGGYVLVDLGTVGEELPIYTLTYDANGGTGSKPAQRAYAGTQLQLGMNNLHRRQEDIPSTAGRSMV